MSVFAAPAPDPGGEHGAILTVDMSAIADDTRFSPHGRSVEKKPDAW
jgi:hypothetical protein